MFNWEKLGRVFNPLNISGVDWLDTFAQAPSVLIFPGFVRVYFSCRPKADSNGQYISYSAYVDLNRENLFDIVGLAKSPILSLGTLGTFDEFGTYPVSVIRADEKVIAYYGGWTRCESVPFNVAIGCAISNDDGVTFEKIGSGPILSYSANEPFILSGPKIRRFKDQWVLFYIAGKKWIPNDGRPEPVYRIRMATSLDGLNWLKIDEDIIPSRIEVDECQASPDVFYYNGGYHMFFCYRSSLNYRGKEGGYRIGYAYSTDMIKWIRDDSKAGIEISSDAEDWDSEMISYPHVFELDGSIYMFYLGNHVGKYGFGLAKLKGTL
ncbi:MAG: hypothetical protein ABI663_22715 [Chryseolinea sp.]